MGDRMLPAIVAAMAFLAALALAGAAGAAALTQHWEQGAASALTVQVPNPANPLPREGDAPEETRLDRALAVLRATPGVDTVHALTGAELAALLRPWLGDAEIGPALPLPAVVRVRLFAGGTDIQALQTRLEAAVPGTLAESHGAWVQRLAVLAKSLQVCAWLVLGLVGVVSVAVITVVTRSGLTSRRESIEIIHGLGATDAYIAGRFASRATMLACLGGIAGAVASVPVLLALAGLAAPFIAGPAERGAGVAEALRVLAEPLARVPPELLLGLPALPLTTALIGFITAQMTVRRWLRRLP